MICWEICHFSRYNRLIRVDAKDGSSEQALIKVLAVGARVPVKACGDSLEHLVRVI